MRSKERERERERQTDRQTDRDRDRQRATIVGKEGERGRGEVRKRQAERKERDRHIKMCQEP